MSYLVSGMVLGLSSGLAPGPLFTLVLSETLRHGLGSGVRVAFAPLITDLPIIALSLIVIANLSGLHLIMGMISLAGAAFVVYLGCETFSSHGLDSGDIPLRSRSLRKGIAANLLNPHPYLFWMTVGSPLVIRACQESVFHSAFFFAGFYISLVGSKTGLAMLAARSRRVLMGRAYRLCMKALGFLLWLFAAFLARDGIRFLFS